MPAVTAHLIPHLLKLFPLFGREHLLQPFVSMLANLAEPRLGFFPQGLQLLARLAEYLLHLRPLLPAELQAVKRPLESVARVLHTDPGPSVVGIKDERARRETEEKNDQSGAANLPSVFADLVHSYFTASSSAP
jgi:hypothetical protein